MKEIPTDDIVILHILLTKFWLTSKFNSFWTHYAHKLNHKRLKPAKNDVVEKSESACMIKQNYKTKENGTKKIKNADSHRDP